jgi:hypothetical protein
MTHQVLAPPSDRSEAAIATGHAKVRRDAPAIYGGLLVTALIAVQWQSTASAELIAISILVSVFVFWLSHVWAEVVDHAVNSSVSREQVLQIAWAEAPMLSAALPPSVTIFVAQLLGVPVDDAIGLALLVSIVQLFLWGLAIGRALNRGRGIVLVTAAVECALGVLLAGLKVVVVH